MSSSAERIVAAACRTVYDALLVPSAAKLLPAAGLAIPKASEYRQARAGWRFLLERRLRERPDLAAGDALWIHAASAGEFLQARALLAALRAARPSAPLVYTYTSPSAAPLLEGYRGADLVLPLPLDTRANARVLLDALRPRAMVFVDAEIWPNLLDCARRRGTRTALVSARLAGDSRRERLPFRPLYEAMYRGFELVGAVDERSAERFKRARVSARRLRITGDLRVDATLERAAAASLPPELPLPSILPLVVAGSTWPDDETILWPALAALRDRGRFFSLAVAPHEVDEKRLVGLERGLKGAGFCPARWSRLSAAEPDGNHDGGPHRGQGRRRLPSDGPAASPAMPRSPAHEGSPVIDAVVVDRVGLLYRLYAAGAAAYVGGAFHAALHNVMEPAAFGVPVVTGPQVESSWFAASLQRACALFPVADHAACTSVFEHLLADAPSAAQRQSGVMPGNAGMLARRILLSHAGATRRTLAALEEAGCLGGERHAEV